MKYENPKNAIIIIAERESVQPFCITRDFTKKDIEAMPGLERAILTGEQVQIDAGGIGNSGGLGRCLGAGLSVEFSRGPLADREGYQHGASGQIADCGGGCFT